MDWYFIYCTDHRIEKNIFANFLKENWNKANVVGKQQGRKSFIYVGANTYMRQQMK